MGKVAILDIEGVLADAEFLPLLAERVGKGKIVHEITLRGIRGEIRWEDGLRQRIDVLKGARYKDAVEVANSMPYMGGASEFCRELKRKGYTLIGVTGGFALFANRIKKELGLDYLFSNELVFNNGMLAGIKPLTVTSKGANGLETTLREVGAEMRETVAVIDGANDIDLFKYAGVRIALNASQIVKKHANVIVDTKNLMDLLRYF